MNIREALLTILDNIDYTAGKCRPNEMIAAILPTEIITLAKDALKLEPSKRWRAVTEYNGFVTAVSPWFDYPDQAQSYCASRNIPNDYVQPATNWQELPFNQS